MKESLEKMDQQKNRKRAEYILRALGFKNWKELVGKKILDIGSGDAELALTGKEMGVNIVCLDVNKEKQAQGVRNGLDYIHASADNIPIDDNSFDLILSHGSVPSFCSRKKDAIAVLNEVKRLLKTDGEFRFGTMCLSFDEDKLFNEEEEKNFSLKQRIERVREKSLEFLQTYDPDIQEFFVKYKKEVPKICYIMQKKK